ncbi:hypothetical protein [uncultured Williamsia sp.]|uniref:hypothetical protein n=1 Tax=uncultured Williamsia sp. TaxID=259311 RepID=UPI00260E5F06|nr:hypothetical protein [uncultured Williamsia sp.]
MQTIYWYDGAGIDDSSSVLLRIDVPDGAPLYAGKNGMRWAGSDGWVPCDVIDRVWGKGDYQSLSEADAMHLIAIKDAV